MPTGPEPHDSLTVTDRCTLKRCGEDFMLARDLRRRGLRHTESLLIDMNIAVVIGEYLNAEIPVDVIVEAMNTPDTVAAAHWVAQTRNLF
jgi:hypothetical protein